MTITIIIAIAAYKTYVLVFEAGGAAVGVGAGGAGETAKELIAVDGQ
jgi:hypothetical protein